MARRIKFIAIHCTATSPITSIASIMRYWREVKGWKYPGYHFIIKADGEVVPLLPIDAVSNGVRGFNHATINIAYIGGIGADKKALDTRTPEQIQSMLELLRKLVSQYPDSKIMGHRQFPHVAKKCPSFNVPAWLESVNFYG